MSMVPMTGFKLSPNPTLVETYPDVYLNMGLTAENLARKYSITREAADAFSLASHQKAIAAISSGKFAEEIVPLEVSFTEPDGGAKPAVKKLTFSIDEGPRADSSLE